MPNYPVTTHREEYFERGWTLLHGFVADDVADDWCRAIVEIAARRPFADGVTRLDAVLAPSPERLYAGGLTRHTLLDTTALDHRPELGALAQVYTALPAALTQIIGQPVCTSPYPRSRVTCKVYTAGDEQGWHFDTNGITVLLYLEDSDGATLIDPDMAPHPGDPANPSGLWKLALAMALLSPECEAPERILPIKGSLLLMQGRRVWHRSVAPSSRKVVAALNYYAGDTWRPAGMDSLVYGT